MLNPTQRHDLRLAITAIVAAATVAPAAITHAAAPTEQVTLGEGTPNEVIFSLPKRGLLPSELLVVYNANQAESIAIKDCYVQLRGIPSANVVAVNAPTVAEISESQASLFRAQIDAALVGRNDIQAIALAWHTPWLVDLDVGPQTSVTTYVGRTPPSKNVEYFDSNSVAPWTDFGFRPAMLITPDLDKYNPPAQNDLCEEGGLIARGVNADGTLPRGKGLLLHTSDELRSVRYPVFESTETAYPDSPVALEYLDRSDGLSIAQDTIFNLDQLIATSDFISNETDVMFHFTGLATVPQVPTNTFLPGAFADHLTSGAGRITYRGGEFFDCSPQPCTPPGYASTQMSALNWLEPDTGATGTYGTVAEPFNTRKRFPNALPLIGNYLYGGTLLEAIGKSVYRPDLGLSLGEPLARPFSWRDVSSGGTPALQTMALKPGYVYSVWASDRAGGQERRLRSNMLVDGPEVTEIRGEPDSRSVTLREQVDPFYLNDAAHAEEITCARQANAGLLWCDQSGQLWFDAPGAEREHLSAHVYGASFSNANIAVLGDTVFWLEPTAASNMFDLRSVNLPDGTPTTVAQVTADSPRNLRASDDWIVWANTPSLALPTVTVFARSTGQLTQQPLDNLILFGSQIALHDATLALRGKEIATGQDAIFLAPIGAPAQRLQNINGAAVDLDIDANWVTWRIDGDGFINDYAATATTSSLTGPWDLGNAFVSLDLLDGKLAAIQNTAEGHRLWVQDLATAQSVLFPQAPHNRLTSLGSVARVGTVRATYLEPGVAPDDIEFSFEVARTYDPQVVRAIDPSVTDRTVPHSETLGFYLRPSDDLLRLGQYTYDVALADGTSPASRGISITHGPLGDANRDGVANFADLALISAAFASTLGDPNYNAAADFNNDGAVNFLDVTYFRDHFLDPDAANAAFVQWDTQLVPAGTTLVTELELRANQNARVRKVVALTAQ